MKKYNLRILMLVCFIVSAVISASASELRVSQLGSAWLVHDEYVDALTNPALISNIEKSMFTAKFYNMVSHQFMSPMNFVLWEAMPRLAYIGKFSALNFGLTYSMLNHVTTDKAVDTTRSLNHYMAGLAGMKLNDDFSIGLKIDAAIIYNAFDPAAVNYHGELTLGSNYDGDGFDAGIRLNAGQFISGVENYNWAALLHGSIETGGESQIRFANNISNSRWKGWADLNGYPDPFGNVFFGRYEVFNSTGISYVNSYYMINYFIELHNDWDVYSYSNNGWVVTGVAYSEETAIRSDTAYLQIGIETKLFQDWFTLRLKYTPLYYSYFDEFRHTKSGAADDFYRTVTDKENILALQSLVFGFGFDLADGMKLDIGLSFNGLLTRDETYYYNPGIPADGTVVQNVSDFSAEFTMKW